MFHKIAPTPGSHPSRTRTGRLRTVMKFALLLIHFQPITLLYGAALSHRPHARQSFVITKGTALIATRRNVLLNSAHTLLFMLAGAPTPSLVSSGTTAPRVPSLARAHAALPPRQQNKRTRNQLPQGPPPPVRPATQPGSATQLQLRSQFVRRSST